MFSFHHDAHPMIGDQIRKRFGNFACHSFLNLQSPGINFDQASEFGESNHFPGWQVSNVAFAEKGQQVVLTKTVKLDASNYHHLF
jgi:hypothetical protein